MTETIKLAPHDPVPDAGRHALVFRHLGEDDPGAVVTEVVFYGANAASTVATGSLSQVVDTALAEAEKRGLKTLYVLDRTAGKLEREALHDHGERSFPDDRLDDADPEDGEPGVDLRDRPNDAGFMR